MRTVRLMAMLIGLLAPVSLVHADTLLINAAQAGTAVNKPAGGMSMDQVLARFGEPQIRKAAVGEPPITQWVYSGFIVYFEGQRVIHSVVPH